MPPSLHLGASKSLPLLPFHPYLSRRMRFFSAARNVRHQLKTWRAYRHTHAIGVCLFSLLFFYVLPLPAYAQSQRGLADNYPGDRGISADQRVLFVEDFEDPLDVMLSHWSDVKNAGGISLMTDVPEGSGGRHSAELKCTGGKDTGAHFYKMMESLADEPVLYLRYYVKYVDSTSRYHHAGGRLGGYYPAVSYPLGGAGIKPHGDDKFTVALEPFQRTQPPRHQFYNYWVGMKPGGDGKYYGNVLLMEDPGASQVVYDQWTAVEIMVKLNTPGKKDGEVAAWINGRKTAHYRSGQPIGRHGATFIPGKGEDRFPGIDFRTDPKLAVNFVKLELYSSGTEPGKTTRIMYDHVVVARGYIGPMRELSGKTR